jgi:hypothetical protein
MKLITKEIIINASIISAIILFEIARVLWIGC